MILSASAFGTSTEPVYYARNGSLIPFSTICGWITPEMAVKNGYRTGENTIKGLKRITRFKNTGAIFPTLHQGKDRCDNNPVNVTKSWSGQMDNQVILRPWLGRST